jgi:hypothetical protein
MIVEVRPQGKEYEVWLVQDVQSFRLDYRASKAECTWYANMLRLALSKHIQEFMNSLPNEGESRPKKKVLVNALKAIKKGE